MLNIAGNPQRLGAFRGRQKRSQGAVSELACTRCALAEVGLSNCVPGRGPETAEIMVVGANPGSTEDFEGVCWIGPAGDELRSQLRAAGYATDSVFYTNAVRCITPRVNNALRAPTPGEIDACRTHLAAEIARIRPKVIIAFGDTALRSLCKLSGVSDKRGKEFALHKDFDFVAPVFATYHPAYVLRVQPARNTVVADLRRIRDRDLPQSGIKWKWMTLDDYDRVRLADSAILAYDIETLLPDGTTADEPTQMQVAFPSGKVGVTANVWGFVWALRNSRHRLVSHFGMDFDDKKTGLQSFRDTAVLAYLDDETQPLGLESLCVRYLGVRGWKEDRDDPVKLPEYGARDAAYTLRLHDHLAQRIGERRLQIADEIIMPARRALDACTARGIYIDSAAVERARSETQAAKDAALAQIRTIASEAAFNPNADRQVGAWLVAAGVSLGTTPSGQYCVDKMAIESAKTQAQTRHLLGVENFCAALGAYNDEATALTTIDKYARAAASRTHRAYSEYTVVRTVVGRTSARHPRDLDADLVGVNCQQLDRDLLDFYSAPPGACFVKVDYSALHFRLVAFCAGEETIIRNYRENVDWDPHAWFARRLFGVAVSKDDPRRQTAKGQFAIMYKGDKFTLQTYLARRGIHISLGASEEFVRAWHGAFARIPRWWAITEAKLKKDGYVETVVGRRRHFGDISKMPWNARQAAVRGAINFLVLGLEPDIALVALARCHALGIPINYFGHDAIGYEAPSEAVAREWEPIVRDAMTQYPVDFLRERFGVTLTVPLAVEFSYKVGKEEKRAA
jgi:uracil-DNA glycosylase family 4